jgi:hypothetical protein
MVLLLQQLMNRLLPLNKLLEQFGLSRHHFHQTRWWWWRLLRLSTASFEPIRIATCCPDHLKHGGLLSAKAS